MIDRNATRKSFSERLQEIIDRHNSDNSSSKQFFDDLMDFVEKEMRAAKEGLCEEELELFDLIQKI